MNTVYLIHFHRPIPGGQARHYVGVTSDLEERLRRHGAGHGALLFRIARNWGIGFNVARTWEFEEIQEAYDMERWLKEMRNTPYYCLVCNPLAPRTNGHHHGACERYKARLEERRRQYERYVQLKRGGLEHRRIREIMRQERLDGIEKAVAG